MPITTQISGSSSTGDVASFNEDNSHIIISTWNISTPTAITVFQYKKVCETGTYTYNQAKIQCAASGYRLPTLAETTGGGGNVPSCGDNYTRTSSVASPLSTHWLWKANTSSNSYMGAQIDNTALFVRCVK